MVIMQQQIKLLVTCVIILGLAGCGTMVKPMVKPTGMELKLQGFGDNPPDYIIPPSLYRARANAFCIDPLAFNNSLEEQNEIINIVNSITWKSIHKMPGAFKLDRQYLAINKFIKMYNIPSAKLTRLETLLLDTEAISSNIDHVARALVKNNGRDIETQIKYLKIIKKNELLAFKLLTMNPATLVYTDITLHSLYESLFCYGKRTERVVYTTMLFDFASKVEEETLQKLHKNQENLVLDSSSVKW